MTVCPMNYQPPARTGDKAGEIYWFAHTKGQIKLASDGRSAIVTVGEDRLWVGLLSGEGKFSVMKAELLPTDASLICPFV